MSARLPVTFPNSLKKQLEQISKEVGISQGQLVVLATHSFVANYMEKGTFIFADLLNPEHRK